MIPVARMSRASESAIGPDAEVLGMRIAVSLGAGRATGGGAVRGRLDLLQPGQVQRHSFKKQWVHGDRSPPGSKSINPSSAIALVLPKTTAFFLGVVWRALVLVVPTPDAKE